MSCQCFGTDAMEEPMNPFDVGADFAMGSTLAVASDEALVISAKAGMHLAYAELCRRHSTSIFRTIHRITRSEDDGIAGIVAKGVHSPQCV